MAKLWITEFKFIGSDATNARPQVAYHPPVATQTPITLGASTQSAAFNAETRYIRLRADATCHYVVGTNPTATTNDTPLDANSPEHIGVPAGMKLAVIAG